MGADPDGSAAEPGPARPDSGHAADPIPRARPSHHTPSHAAVHVPHEQVPPRHERDAAQPGHGRFRRFAFFTTRASRWSVLVPVVALVAGVLFATSRSVASGSDLRSSASNLPDLIREGNRSNEADAIRVNELQTEIDELSELEARTDAGVTALRREGDALAPGVGLVAASGPAVTVSLNDSPLRAADIPPGFTVDDVVVHQQDVQAVVNALWAGGAEAMMLMDQRVIATSAVRCVGNTLILKGRVYSPPFVIRAIGDTTRMQARLDADPTVRVYRQYAARLGLGYEVDVVREATFPPYSGSVMPQFATTLR